MIWCSRFEAYAGGLGFMEALEEGREANMLVNHKTVYNSTMDEGNLMDTVKKCNQVAMATLTMTFEWRLYVFDLQVKGCLWLANGTGT